MLDIIAGLAVVIALVSLGWVTRGWRDDSQRLDDERAAHEDTLAELAWFDTTARKTLAELQDAKQAQGNNRREIIREITRYRDRPCLDPGAVGLLNAAADPSGADGAAGQVSAEPAAAQ